MINSTKSVILLAIISIFSNCSQILQTIDLEVNSKDTISQQEFKVVEKTLTISLAQKLKDEPYIRHVIQTSNNSDPKPILESVAMISNFPKRNEPREYLIGKGDSLILSKLVDNKSKSDFAKTSYPPKPSNANYKLGIGDELTLLQIEEIINQTPTANTSEENDSLINVIPSDPSQRVIESSGRIGSDGSVLLLEVGRLNAAGKTLNQLRSEVRNILIRNGVSPRFQLEITQFRSQRAYLTMNANSDVITLDDKQTNLRDILSSAGKGLEPGVVTRVRLQRNLQSFEMNLRDIFSEIAPDITIKDRDHIFVEDIVSSTVFTQSMVGQDGTVVLEGIGKLKAAGKTLIELQDSVKKSMEKLPNSSNEFQLEIDKFNSKTAIISVPGNLSGVIPITNKPVTLLEALAKQGLSKQPNKITKIKLYRRDKLYTFSFDELFNQRANNVFIEANDRIFIDFLEFRKDKVFILGGVKPAIINIDQSLRQTLADILFTPGGVLDAPLAKRSEVYLLRGVNPVHAYHLDAQNPTRLIVADAMELRPNDILFVAEQPIASFNRTLGAITPLRILLRDIQDENIP